MSILFILALYVFQLDMVESRNGNLVIVFHSYPTKPCTDGLMSVVITSDIHNTSNIALVPYWRTDESYKRLRKTVNQIGMTNTSIIYVDCSPDLEQEVEYLSSILNKIPVYVYDHHPRKKDSPINRLIGQPNFKFTFDADNCAAVMMYRYLSVQQKENLRADKLIKIIQFSEYEGMNPKVAGKKEAEGISKAAFHTAIKRTQKKQSREIENLQKIIALEMRVYFVLDNVLATEKEWKFFYIDSLGHRFVSALFQNETYKYLLHANSVISGENVEVFSVNHTKYYLTLLQQMQKRLDEGYLLTSKLIGSKVCDVFFVEMSIILYGRSLEPFVRKKMKKLGASYAILVNPPAKDSSGNMMYYLSLRRIDENFDAQDLAKFVMKVSGSKIGGGHPWASAATLTQQQYMEFVKKEIDR